MDACGSGHAIVLASWERNTANWLDGKFFELHSSKHLLQDAVGNGGTLWIVVSRPTGHGRLYTVSFRLNNCRSHTYESAGDFGRHAVIGDRTSRFFATADARLLLLALRFSHGKPISGPADNQISNSIRNPRCLSEHDIGLVEANVARADRWSVFISYERAEDSEAARELSEALQLEGTSVFRDLEGLEAGVRWWPRLKRAIGRSQRLIVLVGRTTHQSKWVLREVEYAFERHVTVVPVLSGGSLRKWGALGRRLSKLHALDWSSGLDSVVAGLK